MKFYYINSIKISQEFKNGVRNKNGKAILDDAESVMIRKVNKISAK
ncbi:MAG: hypothetical protein RR636_14460 [Clostridium sp.]